MLTKSKIFADWYQQRNAYEERAWVVFQRRRIVEFPNLENTNGLTWGWEFDSINDDGVNFSYRNYGNVDFHSFSHELLYDDCAVERDLQLLREGVAARKQAKTQAEISRDLAELARLKDEYER